MNALSLLKYSIISIFGCSLAYAISFYFFTALTSISHYQLQIDPRFSSAAHSIAQQEVRAIGKASLTSYWSILTQLPLKVPGLASYTLALRQPHTAYITMHAHEPALIVNQSYYVTRDGQAFDCNQLIDTTFSSLPVLTVHTYLPHDNALNQALYTWIRVTPPDIFADYRISWQDHTNIYLQSVHDPKCTIQCTSTTHLTHQLLSTCMTLIQQHRTQHSTDQWKADVRFDKQIIITKERKKS